jgi:drug/metabolite transporter (DMT)-like permease
MTMARATPVDILLWLALAAAWSSSYAVIKLGIETVEPMVLVAGRMAIAAIVILAVFTALGHRLSGRPSDWLSYGVTGMPGSVLPFLLITHGERSVESALAAILMGLAPVATAVLAGIVLPDERLTARVVLGLAGALLGVALLVGPSALLELGGQVGGQAAIVAATLCYAASTVYIRRFVTRPALEMAAGSSLVGTGVVLALVVLTGAEFASIEPSAASLGAVVYLGLVSTAAANLTYFHLVPRLGATRMSQVNFVVPVGGALLGVLLLGETLDPHQIAALAIIFGAVWVTTTARPSARSAKGNVA